MIHVVLAIVADVHIPLNVFPKENTPILQNT